MPKSFFKTRRFGLSPSSVANKRLNATDEGLSPKRLVLKKLFGT